MESILIHDLLLKVIKKPTNVQFWIHTLLMLCVHYSDRFDFNFLNLSTYFMCQ